MFSSNSFWSDHSRTVEENRNISPLRRHVPLSQSQAQDRYDSFLGAVSQQTAVDNQESDMDLHRILPYCKASRKVRRDEVDGPPEGDMFPSQSVQTVKDSVRDFLTQTQTEGNTRNPSQSQIYGLSHMGDPDLNSSQVDMFSTLSQAERLDFGFGEDDTFTKTRTPAVAALMEELGRKKLSLAGLPNPSQLGKKRLIKDKTLQSREQINAKDHIAQMKHKIMLRTQEPPPCTPSRHILDDVDDFSLPPPVTRQPLSPESAATPRSYYPASYVATARKETSSWDPLEAMSQRAMNGGYVSQTMPRSHLSTTPRFTMATSADLPQAATPSVWSSAEADSNITSFFTNRKQSPSSGQRFDTPQPFFSGRERNDSCPSFTFDQCFREREHSTGIHASSPNAAVRLNHDYSCYVPPVSPELREITPGQNVNEYYQDASDYARDKLEERTCSETFDAGNVNEAGHVDYQNPSNRCHTTGQRPAEVYELRDEELDRYKRIYDSGDTVLHNSKPAQGIFLQPHTSKNTPTFYNDRKFIIEP